KDKVNGALEKISAVGESERSKIREILDSQLKQIEAMIESTRQTAEGVVSNASEFAGEGFSTENAAALLSAFRHRVHIDAKSGEFVLRRADKINRSGTTIRKSRKAKVERNNNEVSNLNNEDSSSEE